MSDALSPPDLDVDLAGLSCATRCDCLEPAATGPNWPTCSIPPGWVGSPPKRDPRRTPGNEPQRLVEVRGGLLNAIGLANVGLKRFVAEKIPYLQQMPTTVLVNVAGHSIEDYVTVCGTLDAYTIAGLELNVSCPNVSDGLMFGTDPRLLKTLVSAVRPHVRRAKLIVKLSPNVTDIALTARAAIDGGADILSLINTYVGMSIDVVTRRPRLANTTGGLSGPGIKPLAVYAVHRVYRQVARAAGIPLIGMGGVQTTEDALELFLAGASAVAVGTALFVDPATPLKIADGLCAYMQQHGISRISEVTGAVELPAPAAKPATSPNGLGGAQG